MPFNSEANVRFQTAFTVAAADVAATFTSAGTLNLHTSILRVANTLNKDIWISFDGTNNHFFVPATQSEVVDLATGGMHIQELTQVYLKHDGAAATTGKISFCAMQAA